ncbi:MAG TPA: hypothetical protein DER60_13050 [Syntrophomonas sp.]|jgi:Fe2+ transport system protein FeoA|nr:hypothetical protein [Syntrophomonas sp.]
MGVDELKTMKNLKIGDKARIASIDTGVAGSQQLMEMGLSPGSEFQLVARYPLRGPFLVKLGNNRIAVDYNLAQAVVIDELNEGPDVLDS